MKIKKYVVVVLCIFFAFVLCACSDSGASEVTFVYGIALDKDESELKMYVLVSSSDGGTSEDESEKSKDSEKDSEESGNPMSVICFSERDTEGLFEKLYKEYEDIYINTNRVYVMSERLDISEIIDFGKYLVNSNKLPLKRNAVMMSDPKAFFEKCARTMSNENFENSVKEEGINAVYFFALAADGKYDVNTDLGNQTIGGNL